MLKINRKFSNGACNLYLLMLGTKRVHKFIKGVCANNTHDVILYFLVIERWLCGNRSTWRSFEKFNSILAWKQSKHPVVRSGVWTKFESRLVTVIRRKTNPRKKLFGTCENLN